MRTRLALVGLAILAFAGLPACRKKSAEPKPDLLANAYGAEPDWNDPQHIIPLSYTEAQGKRLFYDKCVWCHADATPAGPSNRSNLTPTPPLLNDGATLNSLSDDYVQNIITLGGSAMGKSAMMPPWGRTLTQDEIHELISYIRAIAQPPYQPPVRPGPKYSVK
ncbi:MAG: cytochrome c [Acidobacteriia bacterium]|nr:cytochrome c [Terriglobia bacterium]